ncbi:response regulator transcription factor [Pedosphaera parvula]|uniref:Two component transcriptional regulator, LuxR family n=1 Tax=Pedosphaera parvula (strain Ellin514) TaxID=320771 RepID=B9XAQ5_PEDPL|nr:response regulator transcription factor [Pedosphaera parvula]EEF63090.1 two component transcriptional regulator, LuxR family [Pedosphaera parvula Ellin514]
MNQKKKTSPAKATKILLVDDHPMMREGLRQIIGNEIDLAVCGEAENAFQALELVKSEKPDLVLADITLPDKNGLELLKDLQAQHPKLPVLVISMHDEALYAERVLRAGGRGYIMKHEGGKKIMQAIRHVLSGQIFVSEKMSARILELFSGHGTQAASSPIENLTDREFEVFRLIGEGLSTKEIAANMHVSAKTVEVHRMNIKTKLGLKTAAELIRYTVRWVESQSTSGL